MVSGCQRRNRPPEFLAHEGSDLTVGADSGQDAIFFASGAPMVDTNSSLLAYPEFPDPLTATGLKLFTPRVDKLPGFGGPAARPWLG